MRMDRARSLGTTMLRHGAPSRPHPHYLPCACVHGQITALPDSLRVHRERNGTAMVDILAAPQQGKADSALRTLTGISIAHWVSHFHLLVLPMLFPFLKAQLGVGYIELGFALSVFAVVSGVTQPPLGYIV